MCIDSRLSLSALSSVLLDWSVMAMEENPKSKPSFPSMEEDAPSSLISSYLGLSFAVFLGFLPRSSLSHLTSLQSRNRILSLKLFHAEEQIRQIRSRRKEDSKANARVVEIFASHRHAWQQEEKNLLHRIDAAAGEITALRSRITDMERSEADLRCSVERLQREVAQRDEMLDYMSRRSAVGDEDDVVERKEEGIGKEAEGALDDEEDVDFYGDYARMGRVRVPEAMDPAPDPCFVDRSGDLEERAMMFCRENEFGPYSFLPPETWKRWRDSPNEGCQDIQFDSHEPTYHSKNFVARREYPWKVSSDAAGISSKLKLLEQELSNLDNAKKGELSKVPLLLRKQAKRYRSLAEKIDDLCRRMQLRDVCEPSLSPDFRTQRQTEFLVEAFRLQHRAQETRQKLSSVHAETTKSHNILGDDVEAKVAMRRCLDSLRNNFKEIQRNLEIWLARIMGDLEGILARDGTSRVRDYYISRYPFVR